MDKQTRTITIRKGQVFIFEDNMTLPPPPKRGRHAAQNNDDYIVEKACNMCRSDEKLTYTQAAKELWYESWSYAKDKRVRDAKETYIERVKRKIGNI